MVGVIVIGVLDLSTALLVPLFIVTMSVIAWMLLAVQVKRWHDRDKSAFWLLLSLVPIVGWVWLVVEPGFLAGTAGPNRYGMPPR